MLGTEVLPYRLSADHDHPEGKLATPQTRRRVGLNDPVAGLFFSQAPIERENEARRPAAHGSAR